MLPLKFGNNVVTGESVEGQKELTACRMELYASNEARICYGFFLTMVS